MSKLTKLKSQTVTEFAQQNGFSVAFSGNTETGDFVVTAFVPTQFDFPIEGVKHFHFPENIYPNNVYPNSPYQIWVSGDTLEAAYEALQPKLEEQIQLIEATREDERKRLEELQVSESDSQLEGDTSSTSSDTKEEEESLSKET